MSTDFWATTKILLDEVLELPRARRSAFLERQCGGASELRAELDAYLELEDDIDEFIETPVVDLLAGRHPDNREGQRLGSYRLERVVARGGMGVVYLASRVDGAYRQEVAVKILKRGFDTGDLVRRFHRERQILARLDHPNIARILDGGSTDDGLPYYVVEHIAGDPVDRYCEDRRLSVEERLELFCTVCDAVHTAHQNLVVHCDIKPSNILVTEDGVPKLLDFGIAKLLHPDEGDTLTVRGRWLGTPGYASPEQRQGEAISTASDVYALGVLLYELLVAQPPLPKGAPEDAPPPRPSDVAAPDRRRLLQGDLDTIMLKAMRSEPARRYASAAELAEDLRRHLAHLPIAARPDTGLYHLRRFVRRHPFEVTSGVLTLGVIFLSIVLLVMQLYKTEQQRDRAVSFRDAYLELLEVIDPSSGEPSSEATSGALEHALRTELVDDPQDRALLLDRMGRVYFRLGFSDEARRLLEESLRLRRAVPDADPGEVAASLNNLGLLLIREGDRERGLALIKEALETQDLSAAPSLDSWLDEMSNFAIALEENGRYVQAEQLYREVLEHKRLVHSERSQEFSVGLNNLATLLIRQHRLDEAEPLIRQSVNLRRDLLGPEHPQVAKALINLAALLDARGQTSDAIQTYRRALAIRRQHFSEDHPAVARNQAAIAFSLLGRGTAEDLAEAEELLRGSLEVHLARRGPGHHDTLVIQRNLAAALIARGRPGEAEPLLREVVDASAEAWPEGHWRIADAKSVLGHCLLAQGRYEAAEPLVVEGYPVIREVKGEDSRYERDALERVVQLYRNWGREDEIQRFMSSSRPDARLSSP